MIRKQGLLRNFLARETNDKSRGGTTTRLWATRFKLDIQWVVCNVVMRVIVPPHNNSRGRAVEW